MLFPLIGEAQSFVTAQEAGKVSSRYMWHHFKEVSFAENRIERVEPYVKNGYSVLYEVVTATDVLFWFQG